MTPLPADYIDRFRQTREASGLTFPGRDGKPRPMTQDEADALKPENIRRNPVGAAMDAPTIMPSPEEYSLGYSAGRALSEPATKGLNWLTSSGSGPLLTGLAAGGIGTMALGGALLSRATGSSMSESLGSKFLRNAAILSALGLGGYWAYNRMHNKTASFLGTMGGGNGDVHDTIRAIQSALASDPSLSYMERRRLQDAISMSSDYTLRKILETLQTYGSAAAGAVVARYLFGNSLLSTGIGAAVGGYLGSPARSQQYTQFGTRFTPAL
jgi:hypothetical protein